MADDEERRDARNESADEKGLRVSLPPITLPELFPAAFEFRLRPPERVRLAGARPLTLLALAFLVDLADAALALAGAAGPVPTLVATLVGVALLGRVGLPSLWELLPALYFPPLAAVPTLSLLGLLQFRGEFHVLGRGHPEHVERDAERERESEEDDE